MLNKTIEVLENSFCNELKGCTGYIKDIVSEGSEIYYQVSLFNKYYGKVYLKENEFVLN